MKERKEKRGNRIGPMPFGCKLKERSYCTQGGPSLSVKYAETGGMLGAIRRLAPVLWQVRQREMHALSVTQPLHTPA